MDIKFSIKNWHIKKDDKSGQSKVCGTYDLTMNGKVIASQNFNSEYGSIEVPFSGDLFKRLHALENDILEEIKEMIG